MLFTPIRLGSLSLPNRVVMAPLTRQRAGEGDAPTALNALRYAQRASAGLIIAEASQVSPRGKGYVNTPGCHSPEQVAGWRLVAAVISVWGADRVGIRFSPFGFANDGGGGVTGGRRRGCRGIRAAVYFEPGFGGTVEGGRAIQPV